MNRRERLIARANRGFRIAFGAEPSAIFAAPGRVNLIGDHLDYNDGIVLPCAIDRDTVVALGPSADNAAANGIETVALDMGSARDRFVVEGPIDHGENNWQNYVRGVVSCLLQCGYRIKSARIAIAGDIPIGVGLGASASLGFVIALALANNSGLGLDHDTLATIAHEAENEFVGRNCGIMDHLAVAHGKTGNALLLDCQSMQHMPIPIAGDLRLVVIDSGVRRIDDTALAARRRECEQAAEHFDVDSLRDVPLDHLNAWSRKLAAALYSRARYVASEMARVEPFGVALVQGDVKALARIMRDSHLSLSDDFDVSVPPIDRLVDIVSAALRDRGGARLAGAGFGGCVVTVVAHDAVDRVVDAVENHYNDGADIAATITVFEPSDGAARVR